MSKLIKRIEIIRGEEFRPYVADKFNNTDYFADVYQTASKCVADIVSATEAFDKKDCRENSEYDQYLNNIVAFCGERGQGKTGALLTFRRFMGDYKYNEDEDNNPLVECGECRFTTLDVIDPSMFDNDSNILQVIIARMFQEFRKKCENKNKNNDSFEKQRDVMDKFQKVFGFINKMMKPNKSEKSNFYDDSADALIDISDTVNLRVSMHDLVKKYLEFMSSYEGRKFLVIPVDDIDVNIEYAYKMAEQLRKYLIIPNVVILMALKVEQLAETVINHYEKLFTRKNKHIQNDIDKMAERYIEKLLPNGRKIYLPDIRIDAQNDENIDIIYYKSKKDKIKYCNRDTTKDDGTKYIFYKSESVDEDEQKDKKQIKKSGVQEAVLEYIYQCTKLAFVKPQFGIHPLVPETLRELTGLFAVLSHMEKIKNDIFWNNVDNEQKKIIRNNLATFENYFINTWVPNKLYEDDANIIFELNKTNDFKKHRFIITNIYDILYNRAYFSLKLPYQQNVKQEKPIVNNGVKNDVVEFSKKTANPLLYSLGDVIDATARLTETIYDEETTKFVYAVKVVYTITMHRLILDSYTNPNSYAKEYIDICKAYKHAKEEKESIQRHLDMLSNIAGLTQTKDSKNNSNASDQEKIKEDIKNDNSRLDQLNDTIRNLRTELINITMSLRDYEPNLIFKFVGGDIFGSSINHALRTYMQQSRASFDITWEDDTKVPLDYAGLFCTMTKWDVSSLNYNSKFTYNPIVRNAHFNISYLLVNSLDWNVPLSRISSDLYPENNFLLRMFSAKNFQEIFCFITINLDYLQELLQYLLLKRQGNKDESKYYIDHFNIFYSNIARYVETTDKLRPFINIDILSVLKLLTDKKDNKLSEFIGFVWEHGPGRINVQLPKAVVSKCHMETINLTIDQALAYCVYNNLVDYQNQLNHLQEKIATNMINTKDSRIELNKIIADISGQTQISNEDPEKTPEKESD